MEKREKRMVLSNLLIGEGEWIFKQGDILQDAELKKNRQQELESGLEFASFQCSSATVDDRGRLNLPFWSLRVAVL